MIRLDSISLSFGKQVVFDAQSLCIQPDDKIALTGPNGAGKSTLLKVIAGQQRLDAGRLTISRDFRIAYLPQEVVIVSRKSVFDEAMDAFGEVGQWHFRLGELESAGQIASEEYAHLHADLALAGYGEKCAQVRTMLQGLGFSLAKQQGLVSELSVGWQMRVVLAKLLLQEADFYLFDEPTNHLDLPAREWFCSFLQSMRGGYLLISHDRYLLDNACEKTVLMDRGIIALYQGNYTTAQIQIKRDAELRAAARAAQQREMAQMQKTIERFKAKASKAKMAQSMMKKLNKIEVIENDYYGRTVTVPPVPVPHAGKTVLTVEGLKKSFGSNTLFSGVECTIARGQKVALIAPNGVGKTTLLSCIAGILPVDAGDVIFGYSVVPALFEQEQVRVLDANATVLDEVERSAHPEMRTRVRSMLGAFLFSGDEVQKKIKVLSGGERNRVAMAKVLLKNANLLLLDEPTNHLDLTSKQVLLTALQKYEGTILFVSHDRDFVEDLADALLVFDEGKVVHYPGTYASWNSFRASQTSEQKKSAPAAATSSKKQAPEAAIEKKNIGSLEQRISSCEANVERYALELGEHEYGSPAYDQALAKYEQAVERLADVTREWESLYSKKA